MAAQAECLWNSEQMVVAIDSTELRQFSGPRSFTSYEMRVELPVLPGCAEWADLLSAGPGMVRLGNPRVGCGHEWL